MKWLSILFLSTLLWSCGGYSEDEKKDFDKQIQAYLKENQIDAKRSPSGVYTKVTFVGEGDTVRYNDRIRVIYKGYLLNGKEFDRQLSPVEFELKNLIPAWKEALVGLSAGSSVLIISPPQMAYKKTKKEKIPPSSVLVFDITVLDRM